MSWVAMVQCQEGLWVSTRDLATSAIRAYLQPPFRGWEACERSGSGSGAAQPRLREAGAKDVPYQPPATS